MSKTITISNDAHELLSGLKQTGADSFSKVILRHLHPPADTCGELWERLEQMPAPRVNEVRMKAAVTGRGRRNRRS